MRVLRPFAALFVVTVCCAQTPAAKPTAKPPSPAKPVSSDEARARALLRTMTLRERVGQLVIGVCYGNALNRKSPEYEKFRHLIADVRIGGLICVNSVEYGLVQPAEPHAMALFFNQMQSAARIPLLIASDFERSASFRVRNTTKFPSAMAYGAAGDLEASRYLGAATAHEARALGVNWVLAPVADVNNNPINPVINIRSFGENPETVISHVKAFIEGARSDPKNRVLVTVKHFPGHGDSSIDSHLALPHLAMDRERLDAIELKPFKAAIQMGVDAVMTEHAAVPALEPEDIPITVSPKVVTNLLREELAFKNLIVTDAMTMEGLTKYFSSEEAAIRAVLAGSDVLLMPPDPEKVVKALLDAVVKGRISRKRIDESVVRILAAKYRLGLMQKKLVDLNAVSDVIDSPEFAEHAQTISDRAVTVVKNDRNILPLSRDSQPCLAVLREVPVSTIGQRIIQEFRRRAPLGKATVLDAYLPEAGLESALGDPQACSAIVVVSSMSPAGDRTSFKMAGSFQPFLEKLTAGPVPVVFVSIGSPYLLANFPNSTAYMATFSFTLPSELSAVKALFGEIPVTGHLPITIPGYAQIGDGIQIPARVQ